MIQVNSLACNEVTLYITRRPSPRPSRVTDPADINVTKAIMDTTDITVIKAIMYIREL
jgi:hypothetical protein